MVPGGEAPVILCSEAISREPPVCLQRLAMILHHPASWADESLPHRTAHQDSRVHKEGHLQKRDRPRRLKVNRSTLNRYLKRLDESGSLAPERRLANKPPKLDEHAMLLLEEDIKARPWATHSQRSEFLYGVCAVRVSARLRSAGRSSALDIAEKKISTSKRR